MGGHAGDDDAPRATARGAPDGAARAARNSLGRGGSFEGPARAAQAVPGASLRSTSPPRATPLLIRRSQDTDILDEPFPRGLGVFLSATLPVLATFVVVTAITPWTAFATPALAILYIGTQRYFVPTARQLTLLEGAAQGRLVAALRGVAPVPPSSGLPGARGSASTPPPDANAFYGALDELQRVVSARMATARWVGVRIEGIGAAFAFSAALCGILEQRPGEVVLPPLIGLSLCVALIVTPYLAWALRMLGELEGLAMAVPAPPPQT